MLPSYQTNEVVLSKSQPSRTYKLDLERGRIIGFTDKQGAIKQAIQKILYTEKYAHLIYDWLYGIGLEKYIGKDFDYFATDIKRELSEALSYDDRIIEVKDVRVERGELLDSAVVSFQVDTIFGKVEGEEVLLLGGV